jgi:DNA-binding PadR family transcriptional regulator
VAPLGLCQAGIVESVGFRRGALTGILPRLGAARIFDVSREHVRGMDRRVKVYRLTPTGDALVRELRARRPAAEPRAARDDPASTRTARLPRVMIVPPPEGPPGRRR